MLVVRRSGVFGFQVIGRCDDIAPAARSGDVISLLPASPGRIIEARLPRELVAAAFPPMRFSVVEVQVPAGVRIVSGDVVRGSKTVPALLAEDGGPAPERLPGWCPAPEGC